MVSLEKNKFKSFESLEFLWKQKTVILAPKVINETLKKYNAHFIITVFVVNSCFLIHIHFFITSLFSVHIPSHPFYKLHPQYNIVPVGVLPQAVQVVVINLVYFLNVDPFRGYSQRKTVRNAPPKTRISKRLQD